jgi:Ca2+-binding RTX toxin-like protein
VRVSIDLIANDGAVGEGDNVQLDIEDIHGGSGNDQLLANFFQQERNRLSGNAGSDFISVTDGRGGDVADGGSFNDLCFTDPGDPRISCDA